MKLQTTIGSAVTVAGVLGIFISFAIEKSEFDPIAFALSLVSIFIAVIGIAIILQSPARQEIHERSSKRRKARPR